MCSYFPVLVFGDRHRPRVRRARLVNRRRGCEASGCPRRAYVRRMRRMNRRLGNPSFTFVCHNAKTHVQTREEETDA
ncbi:hypothetical protein HMPREF0762_00498 [Slackia exigua ATCC 700122]|uniref:Uncharacterized protein n=1 Tax=Slackia exigua (strain ATCC 700122 / DSM 15923 / CIP 105133 / JCM 11022 / KCTC 5966 / S-7) TaxID=649764 RepID=D0WFI0_SLAES|nr:hypothetical protein HMPREF0762_00498 [Slackia exigua ATCC 700122]